MALFDNAFFRDLASPADQVGLARAAQSNSETLSVAALADGGYAVVWSHVPEGEVREIWARAYAADGTALGEAQKVSSILPGPEGVWLEQFWPSVTAAGEGFMVTWSAEEYNYGYNTGRNVMARLYDAAGTALGDPFTAALRLNQDGSVSTSSWEAYQSTATLESGNIVLAYNNNGDVGLKILAPDGGVLNAFNGNPAWIENYYPNPRVAALKDGNFVVVWQDSSGIDGDDRAVVGRVFGATGGAMGDVFVLTERPAGYQGVPEVVALSDGGFAAAWHSGTDLAGDYRPNITLRLFDADGSPRTASLLMRPDAGEWYGGDGVRLIALDDGGFLALYQVSRAKYGNIYGDFDTYMIRFDAAGHVLQGETRINPATYDGADHVLNDGGQFQLHGAALQDDKVVLIWADAATGTIQRRVIEVSDVNAEGSDGDDFITLTGAGQAVALGLGNDALVGSDGADTITGDDGNDTIAGGGGDDRLAGGAGDDQIDGEVGADVVNGDDGNDTLYGGVGDDTIHGGEGQDTARFGVASSDITVLDEGGALRVISALGLDWLSEVESFEFTDRTLTLAEMLALAAAGAELGTPGNDTLGLGDGDDTLIGGDGDDVLWGLPGADLLLGGPGNDIGYAGPGNDTVVGDGGNDSLFGGVGDDSVLGGDGNDLLGGFTGSDTLIGGAGDDALWGGEGNDRLEGEGGADTLGGSDGDDTLLGGDGADELWGAAGDDMLYGGADNDTLGGSGGNDHLDGGDGDDEIWGGLIGRDTLFGGAGNDQLGGGAENDWLEGGLGNDTISGGRHNDTLYGGSGDDLIFGGLNNDLIDGGAGNDTIWAGFDADVLVFGVGSDVDTLMSFVPAVDTLQLDAALWGGGLTPWQVVSQFGADAGSDFVLDFGTGDRIILSGLAGITTLWAAIDIV